MSDRNGKAGDNSEPGGSSETNNRHGQGSGQSPWNQNHMNTIRVDKSQSSIILRGPNKPFSKVLPLPKILRLPAASEMRRVEGVRDELKSLVGIKDDLAERHHSGHRNPDSVAGPSDRGRASESRCGDCRGPGTAEHWAANRLRPSDRRVRRWRRKPPQNQQPNASHGRKSLWMLCQSSTRPTTARRSSFQPGSRVD